MDLSPYYLSPASSLIFLFSYVYSDSGENAMWNHLTNSEYAIT